MYREILKSNAFLTDSTRDSPDELGGRHTSPEGVMVDSRVTDGKKLKVFIYFPTIVYQKHSDGGLKSVLTFFCCLYC